MEHSKLIQRLLVGLHVLTALTSILGGIGLIITNGLGMPLNLLGHSPFHSYMWPGLILATIVGGSSLVAAVALFQHHERRYEWAAVAGFALLIWIFTELYMLGEPHWLQITYFGFAIACLVLELVLLANEKRL